MGSKKDLQELLLLEDKARKLDLDVSRRKDVRAHVLRWSEAFLERLQVERTFRSSPGRGEGILDLPIQEGPRSIDDVLSCFEENVAREGGVFASPGHLVRDLVGCQY